MKKFIINACLIALIAMIPAVFLGYLHTDSTTPANNREVVKDVNNAQDEITTLRLVRTF